MKGPQQVLLHFIVFLLLLKVSSFAIPTEKKCHVSQEFLTNLKAMITNAIKGSENFPQNVNTSGHGDCEQDLRAIVASLAEIHSETALIKAGGRSTEEVQELKDNFQQEVERLTKERDVFELDLRQETLKQEGEMYDRIHELKRSVQDLKRQIREAEDEFYELAFELVGVRVETNSMDGKEKCYAGMIAKSKFGQFFKHILANHGYKTLLASLYLLQHVHEPKDISIEFMEEFGEAPSALENENHKMVLTFMCWATKQEDRIVRSNFEGCNLYYLFKMTTKFLPTSNDGMEAVKGAEPVLKSISESCNNGPIIISKLKDLTAQKNKEKHENLKKSGKCYQLQS